MSDNPLFEKYGQTIQPGKIIFQEGERGEHMYIIQEGKVRISKVIGGKEHILAVLGKGEFFGEMAIVNQVNRSATATTVEETNLLAFNRQGFTGMIEKNAKIAMNVIDKLCRRLQQTNMQIHHLVKRNSLNLIALHLSYAFKESEDGLRYDRLSEEIAINLELPTWKVDEHITTLEQRNIIRRDANKLILVSSDALNAICEGGM